MTFIPDGSSTFHSNLGRYKETFKCSLQSCGLLFTRDGARCNENTSLPSINFDIANFWCEFKAGVLNFFGYKIERQSLRFAICYLKNSVTQRIKGGRWLVNISGANLRKKMKAALWLVYSEKGMYVGLKQPLGDGERCVTPARPAAKETTNRRVNLKTPFKFSKILFTRDGAWL